MILPLTCAGNFWYSGLMRLLFVADGRSPIAINWIRYFAERGDDVYLATTFASTPDLPLRGLEFTPVAYSGSRRAMGRAASAASLGAGLRTTLRRLLGPLTVSRSSRRLRDLIKRVHPDLVHAMRIPFEGMLAADAYSGAPLLVSVWGNDLTLHAPATWLMRDYTTWTLQVANGLHADCQRDIRLSRQWGFETTKPTLVVPGSGGIRTGVFHPPSTPAEEPVVFNPRGSRAYVRNDVWFQAISLVLARRPDARFVCASLAGDRQALGWIKKLGLADSVQLLPPASHDEMAGFFQRAQVAVSPTVHDGTPNSLLEAMACGCLPVASNLESVREWIADGRNGLLVDPTSPQNLADAILEALNRAPLRHQAADLNRTIIAERAEYSLCMRQSDAFYRRLISSS
jgi:glycosyltransferase involved in cell wall biosynthesis